MPRGVKKVEEVKVEEIKVEEAAVEEAPAAAPVEEVVEQPVEEAQAEEALAETVEEIKEEVAVAEPEAEEKPAEEAMEAEKNKDAEWQFVERLRIYPRPTDLKVIKFITGNVKVIETKGEMKKIQYLKHGFGLVEAFTDAL